MIRKLLAVALAATALTPVVALNVDAAPSTKPYIVFVADGVDPAAKAAQYGVTPTHVYTETMDGFSGALTSQQVSRLRKDLTVISIEADTTWPIFEENPTVPSGFFPPDMPQRVVAGMRRVGVPQSPTADIDGANELIDVDVAVLDSGIQPDHPDLNVAGGVDCTASGSKQRWDDPDGHGTMVAGLVGALDNTIGVVGVAPGVRVWSVKVVHANPSGSKHGLISRSSLQCGLEWVSAHADIVEVANLSLSGPEQQPLGSCDDDEELHRAICDVVDKGVTVVVSAGNANADTADVTPARYPEVITVSAIGDNDGLPGGLGGPVTCNPTVVPEDGQLDDHFAFFSNHGEAVDISAPGMCVLSTWPGSTYVGWLGTSFSAPMVSGAAALYISTHPDATPAEVRHALIDRAEQGPIPGDPDNYPEGVLNIRGL